MNLFRQINVIILATAFITNIAIAQDRENNRNNSERTADTRQERSDIQVSAVMNVPRRIGPARKNAYLPTGLEPKNCLMVIAAAAVAMMPMSVIIMTETLLAKEKTEAVTGFATAMKMQGMTQKSDLKGKEN